MQHHRLDDYGEKSELEFFIYAATQVNSLTVIPDWFYTIIDYFQQYLEFSTLD